MLELPVYLDYSATTPCDKRVIDVMLPYFNRFFGNAASRNHHYGWQAEAAIEKARNQVSQLINAESSEIIFTSGATEACNLALRGIFEMFATKGNHIITSRVEHKAVLDTCKALEKKGACVSYLNVSEHGIINLEELEKAITPHTILIAIMYANNETGVLMPIKEIGEIAKKHKILFFTDGTQAVGKIQVNVIEDAVDIMAFSSHKIYGPKGVGALYFRRKNPRVRLVPQITGGGQEKDFRSGTLNVSGIVGFGAACNLCKSEMPAESERIKRLRDQIEKQLLQMPDTQLNGDSDSRLPHLANISFKYINSSQLLASLGKTIALSAGSACTSGSNEPSFVLKAMGIENDMAKAALRFSLGRFTTAEEVDFAISEVQRIVSQLRSQSFEYQLANKK
ncbi:MAG TPA: IscS subfamily cysteine desulfurase [Niabella sp.]|nr:IscS subfamily cysteine desulfurase [Chitinophagaceae bacterium]HRO83570.1 IscS subfamily cysteine desulfurase [Niabella sp.]HUN01359.1 IscS subfamily cysteine desulfurase [Niabella sp.]